MARRLHSCFDMQKNGNETASSAHMNAAPAREDYDLVILGGGTGSTIAAWTFAGEGQRVAVIDRKYIGGSCPNIACLPSKNIIHRAKDPSYFQRAREFGIIHDCFSIDISRLLDPKPNHLPDLNQIYLAN